MSEKRELNWIQALRGIAALLVVLTHARLYLTGTPFQPLAEQMLRPGAMGVDLFFIVSGFIMVYSTRNSDGSVGFCLDYAIKRFSRVWPPYAVVTLIWVMSVQHGLLYFHNPDNLVALAKGLSFIPADVNLTLYLGVPLPLGWTLEFEMYFYLVFGVCMLFGRLRWLALFAWMSGTLVLLPMIQSAPSFNVFANHNFSVGYLNLITNSIITEFLAGVLIGLLYLAKPIKIKSPLIAYNLMALGTGYAVWSAYSGLTDIHGITNWGGALALMVLCIAIASKTVEITVPRFLVWLGEISFSLYLTHTTSQYYLTRWLAEAGKEAMVHTWSHIFVTTVFAICMASISHRLLEQGLSEKVRSGLMRLLASTREKYPGRLSWRLSKA